ncbi:MAG: hypothetical protein JXR34_00395, partial [Bacteroidales bacterium]|nr:hypothetical protein [Bacteroidales bacterium]
VDECQDIYPTRTKAEVPAFIKFFEKHRHTGCDFFLITQQIRQIDIHLRSLVGDHEDFKRVMGRDLIRVRQLNRVIEGKDETSTELLTSNRPYPKQLFGLYKSAPVHTHKRKMPKILTIVLPLALLFILISFYTVYNVLFDTKPVALLEAEKTSSEAPKKPDAASAVPGLTPSDKSSFSGTTAPQLLLNDDIFVVGEMSYKGALVTMFELYFAGRFIALNTQELVALGFEVSRIAPFLYKVNGSIVSTRPKPDYDRSYTADSDSEKDDSGSGSRSGSSISDAPGSLPQMPGLLE